MKLTRVQRWLLINQHEILAKLEPGGGHARAAEALRCGYELEYEHLAAWIYDEKDTLTEEQCREVRAIFSMYTMLKASFERLEDAGDITASDLTFLGFDGNDQIEGSYMAYAQYVCHDDNQYSQVDRGDAFNSHMPMLSRYQRMLAAWRQIDPDRIRLLTAAEIATILSAERG